MVSVKPEEISKKIDEYVEDKSIKELKDIKDSDEYDSVLFDKDEKLAWFEKMLKLNGCDGESYYNNTEHTNCYFPDTDNSEYSEFGGLIKEKYPDVRFTGHYDFYNDGLRFSTSTSFS